MRRERKEIEGWIESGRSFMLVLRLDVGYSGVEALSGRCKGARVAQQLVGL